MLDIQNLTAKYGAIQALDGVSLKVPQGSIVSLLGANGAGKTTLLLTIMGLVQQISGLIIYSGINIIGMPTERVVSGGIALVPEGRQVFAELTVVENLKMGAYTRRDNEISRDLERVYDLFPRLKERVSQRAGTLSGGEQQMLAIGRALMSRPKLLLLDEPSLGMAPVLVNELMHLIKSINSSGVTVLLVEQNARQALRISHYGYVLEKGRIRIHGQAPNLLVDPHVVSAYLGEQAA